MSAQTVLLGSLWATSTMLSIIFFIAWSDFGRARHALIWSATFAFASVQWAINVIHVSSIDPLPLFELLYWPLANALSIITATMALYGYRQRSNLKDGLFLLVGCGIMIEAILIWVTYIQPHSGLKTVLIPGYSTILLLLMAKTVIQHRKTPKRSEWSVAAIICIFALTQFSAATAGLMQGASPDEYFRSIYHTINFIGMPACLTGMGMFTILIIASDMSEVLEHEAATDELTGLMNRRGFIARAMQAVSQSRRYNSELTVLVFDIDHFKKINDTYGHRVGDEALRGFADIVRMTMRLEDISCRLGGEEFVLTLPNTSLNKALQTANRLREKISQAIMPANGHNISLTASFGVTMLKPEDNSIEDTIDRADEALYRAKAGGRDRVESI